jgi:DNA-binding XRE family transcriptional regulator
MVAAISWWRKKRRTDVDDLRKRRVAENLGANLRDARGRRGISQKRLADRIGLHCTEIGLIERGLRAPRIERSSGSPSDSMSIRRISFRVSYRPGAASRRASRERMTMVASGRTPPLGGPLLEPAIGSHCECRDRHAAISTARTSAIGASRRAMGGDGDAVAIA